MRGGVDRRTFFGVSGAGFVCLMDGTPLESASRSDVARVDRLAAAVKKPTRVKTDPVDALKFDTPQPQPGGVQRVYWIEAKSTMWDTAPTVKRDEWMGMPIKGRTRWRAYLYRQWTEGFGEPVGPASMPGPTLEGEVGDTIVVHLRNADKHFGQAITMHPHGVRYTPDYDGTYLRDLTRIGGYIAPGEEFTYTWECTPDSVGVWPYHDHGPNHTINSQRGLFGQVVVRAKGAPKPDVEVFLWQHQLLPSITGLDKGFQCFNGRTGAGNTPTLRAKVGQSVTMHALGADAAFHTFHVHGHRWKRGDGTAVDNPSFGPHEPVTAAWVEDNPGRWLYHCHVFAHQDAGMAGWYLVEP